MRRWILTATALAAPLAAAGQSPVPAGPPVPVNTYTTGQQSEPDVAASPDGHFVVTWQSAGQDGDAEGVFARWYQSDGSLTPPSEFQVNAYTTGTQGDVTVAVAPDGRSHFGWKAATPGTFDWQIRGRSFSGAVPAGDEFPVNTYTTGLRFWPAIAVDGTGTFTVAWPEVIEPASGDQNVRARRFDADSTPLGSTFLVNTFTTGFQSSTRHAVAAAADGRFVVVWASFGQDGSGQGVFAQRYDAAGTPAGPEFRVHDSTVNDQFRPAVAMGAAGNFIVTWTTTPNGVPGLAVMARGFDATGAPQGPEFVVNETTGWSYSADVAADDSTGQFVVVWTNYDLGSVRGRVVGGAGPSSPELAISASAGWNGHPSVAVGTAGDFVVAWTSTDADGYGVMARRFIPDLDLIFADGFESGDVSRWSTSATDGGDLGVTVAAALDSTSRGLQGVVDDVAPLYVQDDSPSDEGRYRARFWIDPNDFDPGVAQGHRRTRVFIAFTEGPQRRVVAVVLRQLGGVYSVLARTRLDDSEQAETGFFELPAGPHAVELDLRAASAPGVPDGSFVLFIDGVAVAKMGNLANNQARPDFVRLGALSAKGGASGTLYWDEFESRRNGYIGP